MNRQERLIKWIGTIDNEQKNRIILDLVSYAIASEYVRFWDDGSVPYFDGDGETLDGTLLDEERVLK